MCRSLGYGTAAELFTRAHFGRGGGSFVPTHYSELRLVTCMNNIVSHYCCTILSCSGKEITLSQCSSKRAGSRCFEHIGDAGLRCNIPDQSSCNNIKPTTVSLNTFCISARTLIKWILINKAVIVSVLSSRFSRTHIYSQNSFIHSPTHISSSLDCARFHPYLPLLLMQVRLSDMAHPNGPRQLISMLEVLHDGRWGRVCGNLKQRSFGTVACRDAKAMFAARIRSVADKNYSGVKFSGEFDCTGDELTAAECKRTLREVQTCSKGYVVLDCSSGRVIASQ